jgi:hypothetical protein
MSNQESSNNKTIGQRIVERLNTMHAVEDHLAAVRETCASLLSGSQWRVSMSDGMQPAYTVEIYDSDDDEIDALCDVHWSPSEGWVGTDTWV